jgi:N-acylneuraminate cytidylyltransferase
MRLAVIPARGGSKRIPRKNLKEFHGRPIISYSIEAALISGLFDRIWVSTDDEAIADCARQYGAEVPFLRPADLADDYAGTNAVARHAADWASENGLAVRELCCLYATAPFVTADDLHSAHSMLAPDIDFVFAATHFDFPVQRALVSGADGCVSPMFPQWIRSRSQDLPETLHDAGQFYWGRPEAFARYAVAFEARARAYEMPRSRVQDIDNPDDWVRAEQLYLLWKTR